MVKFSHMSDIHLGGWKFPEMQDLNFKSFQKAVEISILEKVDFILIVGDLFDTPFPSIEILKDTFTEFKKIHDAGIKCFIIAGSHDYSVSGKTFLDVIERTGFCKNVVDFNEENEKIILKPTFFEDVAIYGYPGKKTGLEIKDLRRIKLQDAGSNFKILMLHTTIDKALGSMGNLPIDSIETEVLPHADYYALGHLHIIFRHENFVYPGPMFPNNFAELETLKHGTFFIVEILNDKEKTLRKIDLKIKEIEKVDVHLKESITATENIIAELGGRNLEDKIVLLRIDGELERGKLSDINFTEISRFCMEKKAYFVLRNTHDLKIREENFEFELKNEENIEEETIKEYSGLNNSEFNSLISSLMNSLSIEKQEGETSENFTRRILDESRKILNF